MVGLLVKVSTLTLCFALMLVLFSLALYLG